MAEVELIEKLKSIGLTESKAKETLKNANLTNNLKCVINSAEQHSNDLGGSKGNLLYNIASKTKAQISHRIPLLGEYVALGKIDSEVRLNAAIEYLMANISQSDVDKVAFESACGVGVIITSELIETEVGNAISKVKAEIIEKRYRFNSGLLMSDVRKKLKWADGKAVKNEIDIQILDLLGPKTEADLAPPPKEKKVAKDKSATSSDKKSDKAQKSSNTNDRKSVEDEGATTIAELMKTKVHFHKPGENYKTDGYVIEDETMNRLKAHLLRTKGQVRTRFPPEPNGILHVGHAKAININFGYAAAHDGICFLRYDDTNPEKEEEKFFTAIKDTVEWLGYKPYKITHSSDNFDQLYEWAKLLIKKDLAYVCHQRVEDIRGFNPPPSPWRNRPLTESLQLFEDMKNGKFDEGEATLRLKTTLEEGKQDPVAYRIKYAAHHRTGEKWCIYPTYDYTHCLCDSIEDITHSLCTKEFQARRSSYYWLCNAVEAYCPVQWEYGRLNVNYAVVSKRKIGKLISSGICSDWDDPRLFTLTALKRRGFPPEAINSFCASIGVTGAQMTIDPSMLEAFVRSNLNLTAPRTMVVLEPLKVNIRNFAFLNKIIAVPDFPDNPEKGSHNITFSPTIYIEKSDLNASANVEKGYRRLTRDQEVGLRYANFIMKLIKVHQPRNGADPEDISEIDVECIPVDEYTKKPKAFIHWVGNPVEIEVRLYERLFKHKNPEDTSEVPGGFLTDVNEKSLITLKSMADSSILKDGQLRHFDKYQFERHGFFSVDPDSDLKTKTLVFNRTVSLKEDSGK